MSRSVTKENQFSKMGFILILVIQKFRNIYLLNYFKIKMKIVLI